MEFKGTKGKWTRYHASIPSIDQPTTHSVYVGTQRIALCYDLFESDISKNVDNKNAPYNAQLISKAPEMLEMLKMAKEGIENMSFDQLELLQSDIEHLIKEATNI